MAQRTNPVNLAALATNYLRFTLGTPCFFMMTQLGWSVGSCKEGPDQFYTVIERGQAFLKQYPDADVSQDVRLAVADAYATWWNLSRNPPAQVTTGRTHEYSKGADQAKATALELYAAYLRAPSGERSLQDVRGSIDLLKADPQGSNSFDYFCGDYAD